MPSISTLEHFWKNMLNKFIKVFFSTNVVFEFIPWIGSGLDPIPIGGEDGGTSTNSYSFKMLPYRSMSRFNDFVCMLLLKEMEHPKLQF